MKVITKYQAIDGREFNSEADCLQHESLLAQIEAILPLKAPNSCEFANGGGYIQHSAQSIQKARKELIKLAKKIDSYITEKTHITYLMRVLDDMNSPLTSLAIRLYCIDSQYREWGQPYFAINPDKGQQIKLN